MKPLQNSPKTRIESQVITPAAFTPEKASTPSPVMEQPTEGQFAKMDKPKTNPLDYVQKNYCKFDRVEKPLQELLEENRSEKEIAVTLGISLPTVHKYKNILALKNNKLYATQEERNYLEKQEKRAALASAASVPDARAAPSSSSNLATSSLPYWAAIISGVVPLGDSASM